MILIVQNVVLHQVHAYNATQTSNFIIVNVWINVPQHIIHSILLAINVILDVKYVLYHHVHYVSLLITCQLIPYVPTNAVQVIMVTRLHVLVIIVINLV